LEGEVVADVGYLVSRVKSVIAVKMVARTCIAIEVQRLQCRRGTLLLMARWMLVADLEHPCWAVPAALKVPVRHGLYEWWLAVGMAQWRLEAAEVNSRRSVRQHRVVRRGRCIWLVAWIATPVESRWRRSMIVIVALMLGVLGPGQLERSLRQSE